MADLSLLVNLYSNPIAINASLIFTARNGGADLAERLKSIGFSRSGLQVVSQSVNSSILNSLSNRGLGWLLVKSIFVVLS